MIRMICMCMLVAMFCLIIRTGVQRPKCSDKLLCCDRFEDKGTPRYLLDGTITKTGEKKKFRILTRASVSNQMVNQKIVSLLRTFIIVIFFVIPILTFVTIGKKTEDERRRKKRKSLYLYAQICAIFGAIWLGIPTIFGSAIETDAIVPYVLFFSLFSYILSCCCTCCEFDLATEQSKLRKCETKCCCGGWVWIANLHIWSFTVFAIVFPFIDWDQN